MPPTLYNKGVLIPASKKLKKEDLDNYVAIHYLMAVIKYKLEKQNPNYHDRIFLLKSETGTGKSTSFIFEMYRAIISHDYSAFDIDARQRIASFADPIDADLSVYNFTDDSYTKTNRKKGINEIRKKKNLIMCTQPKVLTAMGKAIEIAAAPYNPDLILGENVGYTTGSFKYPIPGDGIMFATLGSFIQTLKLHSYEDVMAKYSIVVIDECHIRSIALDTGMVVIRNFLRATAGNPACPLFVFTSATFDIDKYANYLETPIENSLTVVGTEARLEVEYRKEPSLDYIKDTADKVMEIHKNNPDDTDQECDILVFAHKGAVIKEIMGVLNKYDAEKHELILYKLDSQMVKKGGDDVTKIAELPLSDVRKLEKQPTAKRRVTIATDVAETGITIPTLKYVIDIGFNQTMNLTPQHRLPQLVSKNVVRSAVEQRLGRVGRNFYGYAYTMYPESVYKMLPEYELPEIYTSMDAIKAVLDGLYSEIPGDYIHKPIEYEKFTSFISGCTDVDALKLSKTNLNCNNIYNNTIIDDAKITSIDNFVDGVSIKNYPVEMLDNIPKDLFLVARNTLISLGFYGTYAGYIASRIPGINIEGARMLITSMAYGVSIGDAAFMAIAAYKGNEFMISDYIARKTKMPRFDIHGIIHELTPKDIISKYFFGSVNNFVDVVADDFIFALIVSRYIIHHIKSVTEKDIAKYKPKYQIEERRSKIKASRMTVVNQRLMERGIDIKNLTEVMKTRIEIMETCDDLGLIDVHNPFDLTADDIIDQIARLKRCIYSGYKNNLLVRDDNRYFTSTGVPVKAKGVKKNKLLYGKIMVMQEPGSILYKAEASIFSSLDGWI